MFDLNTIINIPPYSLNKGDKSALFNMAIASLTAHHYERCENYHRILRTLNYNCHSETDYYDSPFLPVRLFKDFDLLSVEKSEISKTMTSSGTSGQKVSRIYLDKTTAVLQTKVLNKIVSETIGQQRLPLLIIDSRSVVKNRALFSARGAGILGFSMFGKDVTYALDESMELDADSIASFYEKYNSDKCLIFGFTYIIWEYFIRKLIETDQKLLLDKSIIIHGGGWKQLNEQAIDNELLKKHIIETCGISNVFNYYGMVEQTGSIFTECEEGYLHCSIFSDVITRRDDFSICDKNERGLVQLLSLIPVSYPGHNLLSEDIGEILGEDDCKCCRLGKYFRIYGRAENAELRGCSDTVERI